MLAQELGKLNIAACASKDENDKNATAAYNTRD